MILIQRIRKIKGKPWFNEILLDGVFYILFFIIGTLVVLFKISEKEGILMLIEETNIAKTVANKDYDEDTGSENKYVASSRGKYFYEIGSDREKSLSAKNKIYFSTFDEAKELGFKPYLSNWQIKQNVL